jgi:hypothetical protein
MALTHTHFLWFAQQPAEGRDAVAVVGIETLVA